jgi:hypothetical protein
MIHPLIFSFIRLKLNCIEHRFIVDSRKASEGQPSSLDDSGYVSLDPSIPRVSPILVDELERGYEALYLCKPGSLKRSYDAGTPLPFRDSPIKYFKAINTVPGWSRGLTVQFERLERFRVRSSAQPELISIPNDEE